MDSYLGQIGIFGWNWAPLNWALCNGAVLSTTQNTALFSLIGTIYGGNGTTNFALPDLRSRTPVGAGNSAFGSVAIGEDGGVENVTLQTFQMPIHTHNFEASDQPSGGFNAQGLIFGAGVEAGNATNVYTAPTGSSGVILNPGSLSPAGGSQSHPNIQPSLAINFCICTAGIFPPRG